jgi:adenylate cyclase
MAGVTGSNPSRRAPSIRFVQAVRRLDVVRIIAGVTRSILSELKRRNVLRVAMAYAAIAWLLIQIAETVMPLYGFDDSAARTIVTVLVVGFVPVIALAWIFEWTPEGIRRDANAPPRAPGEGKWLDRVIVVTLVIAVIYFAIDKFVFDPARDAAKIEEAKEEGRKEGLLGVYGEQSIAVLPFDNLSDDPTQDFFGLGIAEEMLNLLARIPELRVISRTSSFRLSEQGLDIPEIAERLDVANVLEGSVRVAGNKLRITAQLIEGATNSHIWSDTWDRELSDIFAIQDEIAAEIVRRLEILLSGEMPRSVRTDPVTYALTLEAREHDRPTSTADPYRGVELLRQALELDPDYVPALLQLNYFAWQIARYGEHDTDEMSRLERETYHHVVEIAPDDPEVVARRAWEAFEIEHDWPTAANLFERAVNLDPGNPRVLQWSSAYSHIIGRHDTAITLRRRQLSIDPLCVTCAFNLMRSNYAARRTDEALEWHRVFREMGGSGGYMTLGKIHLLRGEPELALQAYEKEEDTFLKATGEVMALHDLGREQEVRALLADLESEVERQDVVWLAEAAAWIGDVDGAFKWLEHHYEADNYRYFFFHVYDPIFEKLHDDPRWLALRRKVNMSEQQLAAIEFNPRLP